MRSRNIKPDFFRDYQLCQLDIFARVLFSGLWCLADREGRLEDCPPRIRADVFPYDNVDVEKLLESLATSGFITRYTVEWDTHQYIQIKNFHKHQNPHKNEKPSEIPAVEDDRVITGQTQEITGANRADSLLLIPDSLIPDSLIPDADETTDSNSLEENKTEKPHQQQMRKILAEKREKIITLSKIDPEKFDLIAEQCVNHYRDKPPPPDCYAKILAWFKREYGSATRPPRGEMSQTAKGLAVLAEMRRRANEVDNIGNNDRDGAALLLETERVSGSGSVTENHAGMDKVINATTWQTRNRTG